MLCRVKECSVECSPFSTCEHTDTDACHCFEAFTGDLCTDTVQPADALSPVCNGDCSGNGDCSDTGCVCFAGYFGTYCEYAEADFPEGARGCNGDCSGAGTCVRTAETPSGECACNFNCWGPFCSHCVNAAAWCWHGCSGNGVCHEEGGQAWCDCNPGFGGEDCSLSEAGGSCYNDCSGRGSCEDGYCTCEPGFSGAYCEYASCPDDCNGHGWCDNGAPPALRCALP